jgi:UrcA family protein
MHSKLAFLAGAAGLVLMAAQASAQNYGPPPPRGAAGYGPNEEITVQAPRFREQGSAQRSLDLPPERVSLSVPVRYDDLDLRTRAGAFELRRRVVRAAYGVCGQLRDAYPFHPLTSSPSCLREARDNALSRADSAISEVRADWRDYHEGRYEGRYGD